MDYQKIYNQIVNRARSRKLEGYVERHHILPKSMGGSNAKENLVDLTAREHFICHVLLAKIHGGKMWMAVKGNSGKVRTEEAKYKMDASSRGKVRSESEKEMYSRAAGGSPIIVHRLNGKSIEYLGTYPSIRECSRTFNIQRHYIKSVISGEIHSVRNLSFKRV